MTHPKSIFIYSKLQIGGDTRTKRKRLIDLLNSGS